jgi:predicted hotdog family 3-hydroxylacyl-ACP dehydratase
MLIDRSDIVRLIPHADDMCLLDVVRSWDASRIQCATASHRLTANPLRRDGRLGILCGVEYAAQAMALHTALTHGGAEASRRGYLASLRAVSCHVDRLDLILGTLLVEAECLHGEAGRAIYSFVLRDEDRLLLNGRAAVVLEPGAA